MKTMSLAAAVLALAVAAPAVAVETLTATFTQPDGGVSARSYSGDVRVTVSGTGNASGKRLNDAFYLFSPVPIEHSSSYYQLTFGTKTLVAHDKKQDALNFIAAGLPAYNPSHVYSFILDTKTVAPAKLHFGVSDGMFSDNSGSYLITIAVPEPATWGLMIAGFGAIGVALRRRTRYVAA